MTRASSIRRAVTAALPAALLGLVLSGCAGGAAPPPGTSDAAPGNDTARATKGGTSGTAGTENGAAGTGHGATEPTEGATGAAGPTGGEDPDSGAPPVAVRVPSLGLDERLVDLGLTASGALEVPEDPDRVGWYTGGGRPGGRGPTVVVGHVDSTDGPAVFARLTELTPGDVVVMRLEDGSRVRYRVDAVRDHPQVPFPTEAVFGATAMDTLRLITCTGPYDSAAGRYTENRVVYATALGPPG